MNLHLRVPPLGVMVIVGLLAWAVARVSPTLSVEWPLRTELVAAFLLLGVVSSLLGVAAFRRARTTVNPLRPGTATALVVSGIYRITRNPMYLGFLLLLLAEIVWLANPVALLGAPAFVLYLNRFQIGPEEQALHAHFGPEFSNYAARVRRWI